MSYRFHRGVLTTPPGCTIDSTRVSYPECRGKLGLMLHKVGLNIASCWPLHRDMAAFVPIYVEAIWHLAEYIQPYRWHIFSDNVLRQHKGLATRLILKEVPTVATRHVFWGDNMFGTCVTDSCFCLIAVVRDAKSAVRLSES